ncbi:hypothetical protein DFJ74DRAFT_110315 [Hyaloraphidium curvatum]|nr:hypothetical protein DFJ74DRAFT_110315 [Hyaloraphidium curvatum]
MDGLPATYKAVEIKEFSPSFRKAAQVATKKTSELLEKLAARPDGVLVRVHYTTPRASDRNDSNGNYGAMDGLPFVAGFEGVGRVVKVGTGVQGFREGDAVGMVLSKRGAAAEYNVFPAHECFHLPAAIPEFLTFFNAGLTALGGLITPGAGAMRVAPGSPLSALFPSNVDAGTPYRPETVVVTAAAGGVGLMACQLALAGGNTVVGLAGNDEKLAVLKGLGVQHAVNYKSFATPQEMADRIKELAGEADIIWETVGGQTLLALSGIVAKGGRLVIIGQISNGYGDEEAAKKKQEAATGQAKLEASVSRLLAAPNPARDKAIAEVKARGGDVRSYLVTAGKQDDFFEKQVAAEVELWKMGKLKGITDDTMGFTGVDKYIDAVEYLHDGKNIGKVVVKVASDADTSAPKM